MTRDQLQLPLLLGLILTVAGVDLLPSPDVRPRGPLVAPGGEEPA